MGQMEETQNKMDGLEKEFTILNKENKILDAKVNVPKCDGSTQTDFAYILEDVHMKAVQAENAYLNNELNALIAERSKFKSCIDTDYHQGDICSMVCSPLDYAV